MRVTNAPASRKRRKRMLTLAKGFRLKRSKLYRYASDAGCRSRVDDVLLLVLVHLRLVRVTGDQDVDVQLTLKGGKSLRIAPRHAQVTVRQTERELAEQHTSIQ